MSTREQRKDPITGQDSGPRTRTELSVEWCVWHFGELAGIGVPAVLAASVNGWFGLVSGLVAAGWGAHEARVHRNRRQIEAARPALPAGTADDDDTTADATDDTEATEGDGGTESAVPSGDDMKGVGA